MNSKVVDSPFVWSGKKTKLLPQIKPLFPNSKICIDLFGGSGSVSVNFDSEIVFYNDLFMGELIETIRSTDIKEILNHCDNRISQFNLNRDNKDGYYKFKELVTSNELKDDVYYLDLFTISLFAFNGRLEFNKEKGLTSGFGKRDRRKVVEQVLYDFKEKIGLYKVFDIRQMDFIDYSNWFIKGIQGSKKYDIEDVFVYVDCPYSITRINGYKSDYNDENLFKILKKYDNLGIKWAMSNVFEHKGKVNKELIEFSKDYTVHHLNYNYSNMNNSIAEESQKERDNITDEVLITNYWLNKRRNYGRENVTR